MEKQPRPHPGYKKSETARMSHCAVLRPAPPHAGIAECRAQAGEAPGEREVYSEAPGASSE